VLDRVCPHAPPRRTHWSSTIAPGVSTSPHDAHAVWS